MNIRVLHYFVTVVQEKSISRAAEVLHITQPTLSRQIKDLEEELETVLLIRGGRELQITAEGQFLYNRALEILELVDKTEQNFRQTETVSGDLYIGAAESASLAFLARVSQVLSERYPGIVFHFRSGNSNDSLEKLDAGLLDLCVIIGPVDEKKYHTIPLPFTDKWGVLVPNHHPLTKEEQVSVEDLEAYPLLLPSQTTHSHPLYSRLDQAKIAGTYNLLYNASLLVESGLGIAVCLSGIVSNPNLTFIALDFDRDDRFQLVWKKGSQPPRVARVFIDTVNQALEED